MSSPEGRDTAGSGVDTHCALLDIVEEEERKERETLDRKTHCTVVVYTMHHL
jgi:hypothetical protein